LRHTTEAMTADYIRYKVGRKVKPLRRIAEQCQILRKFNYAFDSKQTA